MKTLTLLPALLLAGLALAFPRTPGLGAAENGSAGTDDAALVARGEYLVNAMACADCHTPHVLGPEGPMQDPDRRLSGHPASLVMPPAPELPEGPWVVTMGATNTAWAGPWGTSFTANLTPDVETGLGSWSLEEFSAAVRNSRHRGFGRPILPPMPVFALQALTDEDLRAVFAYLRSLPPIHNPVPEPLPPAGS